MAHLNTMQIEEFRQRLVAMQHEIESLREQTARDSRPVDLGLPIGRLSRADALQMQGMAQMNRRQQDIKLQQVKVALAAVCDGSYGSCRSCRKPIDIARLEVRPESPFCVACQESFESER